MPGRGGLQIDADILAALEAGELYAASLDVFETEPLPARARCGRIRASSSRRTMPPKARRLAIVRYALRQRQRHLDGLPLENVVDRKRGY